MTSEFNIAIPCPWLRLTCVCVRRILFIQAKLENLTRRIVLRHCSETFYSAGEFFYRQCPGRLSLSPLKLFLNEINSGAFVNAELWIQAVWEQTTFILGPATKLIRRNIMRGGKLRFPYSALFAQASGGVLYCLFIGCHLFLGDTRWLIPQYLEFDTPLVKCHVLPCTVFGILGYTWHFITSSTLINKFATANELLTIVPASLLSRRAIIEVLKCS